MNIGATSRRETVTIVGGNVSTGNGGGILVQNAANVLTLTHVNLIGNSAGRASTSTIAQNGGSILSPDKKTVTIDSPENIETLTWMIDKVSTYKVTPSDVEMAGQSSEDLFKAGKLAMLRTGIWLLGDFTANAKFNWDIALEPGKTNKAHHFFANGVAVSANSAHPAEAYQWIKFLTW